MDNSIVPENIDGLKDERAAVAALLAAAREAQAAETAPEPVEDIDFNGLVEKRKVLQNQLTTLRSEETKLLHQVQLVREQSAEVERQIEFIAAKAKALFESTFERPALRQTEQQPPQPQPTSAAPRKPDNSIVFDTGSYHDTSECTGRSRCSPQVWILFLEGVPSNLWHQN